MISDLQFQLFELKLHLCHRYQRKNTPGHEAIKEGEQKDFLYLIFPLVHRVRNYEFPIGRVLIVVSIKISQVK